MNVPLLRQLFYHRDYDGVVAAAMIQASTGVELDLMPIQYAPNLDWIGRHLDPGTGIVDFLFHPEAALWIDHHETTFSTEAARLAFRPDPFHVFVPQAASCPSVIAPLPWFDRAERWQDYVYWADIIDGASYESPKQANDFANPHVLIAHVIAELPDSASLSALIRAIGLGSATEALDQSELRSTRDHVLQNDEQLRRLLSTLLRLDGGVAVLDQSELVAPYRRYLAYELYPSVRYGIGLYRSDDATIVSVGENPWNSSGLVHLGHLCREFGGGGRRSTAGMPATSIAAARQLAKLLTKRLNDALLAEHSVPSVEGRPSSTGGPA